MKRLLGESRHDFLLYLGCAAERVEFGKINTRRHLASLRTILTLGNVKQQSKPKADGDGRLAHTISSLRVEWKSADVCLFA